MSPTPSDRRKAREAANVKRGIKVRAKVVADIQYVWSNNTVADFVTAMRKMSMPITERALVQLWDGSAPVYFDVSPIMKQQDFDNASIFLTTEMHPVICEFFVSQMENMGYVSVTVVHDNWRDTDPSRLHLIRTNDHPEFED